jgi:hypothetical protein
VFVDDLLDFGALFVGFVQLFALRLQLDLHLGDDLLVLWVGIVVLYFRRCRPMNRRFRKVRGSIICVRPSPWVNWTRRVRPAADMKGNHVESHVAKTAFPSDISPRDSIQFVTLRTLGIKT